MIIQFIALLLEITMLRYNGNDNTLITQKRDFNFSIFFQYKKNPEQNLNTESFFKLSGIDFKKFSKFDKFSWKSFGFTQSLLIII